MRLIYHPDAETELIQAARYYESRVATLGVHFLDEADRAVAIILEAPGRWRIIERTQILDAPLPICDLLSRFFGPASHSCFQTSQPTS